MSRMEGLPMPRFAPRRPQRLEDLPNIGKAIAADLRRAGIHQPEQLVKRDPLETFHELSAVMGRRQDSCVLYALMAVQHYLNDGVVLPWWTFTERGKALLKSA